MTEQFIQITASQAAVLYDACRIAIEATEPKLNHKGMARFKTLLKAEIAGYRQAMSDMSETFPELVE